MPHTNLSLFTVNCVSHWPCMVSWHLDSGIYLPKFQMSSGPRGPICICSSPFFYLIIGSFEKKDPYLKQALSQKTWFCAFSWKYAHFLAFFAFSFSHFERPLPTSKPYLRKFGFVHFHENARISFHFCAFSVKMCAFSHFERPLHAGVIFWFLFLFQHDVLMCLLVPQWFLY